MKVIAPELRLATCWDLFRAWIGYPQLHVFESGQDDDEYVYEALERHNQLRKARANKKRYPYTCSTPPPMTYLKEPLKFCFRI